MRLAALAQKLSEDSIRALLRMKRQGRKLQGLKTQYRRLRRRLATLDRRIQKLSTGATTLDRRVSGAKGKRRRARKRTRK